jgi:integrin-linked kinase-associated serine/threonine phosphatase 2C
MKDEEELSLKIISKPFDDAEGANGNGFAYREIMVGRSTQEDALVWEPYDHQILQNLSSQDIGQRLWTAYQILNENFSKTGSARGGTTASTTIISKQHLITATLADAVSFAVIYSTTGEVVGVHRLNSKIYTPNTEIKRIKHAGGSVTNSRIEGMYSRLAVSRAIGDKSHKAI